MMRSRLLSSSPCWTAILFLPLLTAPMPVWAVEIGMAVPATKFLDARGRVCMDAVLASGGEKTLDLHGYQVFGTTPVGAARFAQIEAIDRREHASAGRPDADESRAKTLSGCWSDAFPHPGLDASVGAVVEFGGKLVLGGSFTIAGKTANYIAAWNGSSWDTFGSGMNGPVSALAVYDGKLVAGGDFTIAGGVAANRIAIWDGTHWSPLGQGMSDTVEDLAVWNGNLVATGDFTVAGQVYANRIAKWNGTVWSALGDGLNDDGSLLAAYGTKLVVTGEFSTAGTVIVNRIAAWQGSTWNNLGPGLVGYGDIASLVVRDGLLIAGGDFDEVGLNRVPYLAAWDGANWNPYGGGSSVPVSAMAIHGSNLAVAFHDESSPGANGTIELWNGTSWVVLAEDAGLDAYRLATFNGDLVACGWDSESGPFVADWNGTDWSLLRGPGLDGPVNAIAEYEGDLIIGGGFTQVGPIRANRIARWDGTTWQALGSGIGAPDDSESEVRALEVVGADLFVGGQFAIAGGDSALGVARWNGVHWSALGGGLRSTYGPPSVSGLEMHQGKLFVGGRFDDAGGVSTNNVAAWNLSSLSWSAPGEGFSGDNVNALLSFDTMLVAGWGSWGVGGVMAWDGTSWVDLGFEPTSQYAKVLTLAAFDGDLVVGGMFGEDSQGTFHGVARWDGVTWNPMDGGALLNALYGGAPAVYALASHDGQLVAGGQFNIRGHTGAANLAAWDGSQWVAIDQGVGATGGNPAVHSLLFLNSSLVVGGNFTKVGSEVSANLAIYTCPMPTDVAGGDEWKPALRLGAGVPNPFGHMTRIRFDLPRNAPVSVAVFDVSGRRVRSLLQSADLGPGPQGIDWDGRDDDNRTVAPGTYFIRLETNGGNRTAKVTRLR